MHWRQRIVESVQQEAVLERIAGDSGWSGRYAFMTMMSAGIAVLGLLLSSPAVVIGAMLISPLMSPLIGLGFALALFDFSELRRASVALVLGALTAVLFTALIVLASPLKAPTAEILARTRPNLFDLLVAMFAALAGTYAFIRGRGETIVGVAIATALMPPLAVIGYALATRNMPALLGALTLFVTNFLTIILSATAVARFYGFGGHLSSLQSWKQTGLLLAVFAAMAGPLAISLNQIATEAILTRKVRSFIGERFGEDARVTGLDIDFDQTPIRIRSVVIAPRSRLAIEDTVRIELEKTLDRAVSLNLNQVLIDPGERSIEAQRAELRHAEEAAAAQAEAQVNRKIREVIAVAAGVSADKVIIDVEQKRAATSAAIIAGAELGVYRVMEARVAQSIPEWKVAIRPPLMPLPMIRFASGADSLDQAGKDAVLVSSWAAERWGVPALAVPGLPGGQVEGLPPLAARRAFTIAALARDRVSVVSAPANGRVFRLIMVSAADRGR